MTKTEHPIRAIRRAGVPLAGFETSDPAQTIRETLRAMNGKAEAVPVLQWDCLTGLSGLSKPGKEALEGIDPLMTLNPAEMLKMLADIAGRAGRTLDDGTPVSPLYDSIVWMHNAPRFYQQDPVTLQGIWNLRDALKTQHATLILLGPTVPLPAELKQDVVTFTDALPDAAEIETIVSSISQDAGIPIPAESRDKVTDSLLGLSAFAAEQVFSMSLRKDGIDMPGLWEKKRRMIEQTPGLKVWRGGERYADIGGCENIKGFMRDILRGKSEPRGIVFIDEIEKAMAGTAGDLSGISQDAHGYLLQYMQDRQACGVIFIGPPGAAKSVIAKATGNEAGIPTIQVDMGAMRGSLVGQSEQNLRQAFAVIDAVTQGRSLFIATCNSFGAVSPELKRRFTLGTFFFDLPDITERQAIWDIYLRKYDLDAGQTKPADNQWTGAEIQKCCEIAWRLNRPLTEAAKFIVPVAKSAAEQIDKLRKDAAGKFTSAAVPGLYEVVSAPSSRKMEL